MSKWANPHFDCVSPLLNFKERINTMKISLITEQIKVSMKRNFAHMQGKPPFSCLCCFPDFPQKWVSPLVPKSDQLLLTQEWGEWCPRHQSGAATFDSLMKARSRSQGGHTSTRSPCCISNRA